MAQIRQIGDLDNPHNEVGIARLTEMMGNAWTIKQAEPDWVPKDGDPRADNVIWGFVKGANNPETDIDFAICHGIERTLTDYHQEIAFTQHKDWLLCALNDVIALRGFRGQGHEAKLLPVWSTPRPNGLGWLNQKTMDEYRKQLTPRV